MPIISFSWHEPPIRLDAEISRRVELEIARLADERIAEKVEQEFNSKMEAELAKRLNQKLIDLREEHTALSLAEDDAAGNLAWAAKIAELEAALEESERLQNEETQGLTDMVKEGEERVKKLEAELTAGMHHIIKILSSETIVFSRIIRFGVYQNEIRCLKVVLETKFERVDFLSKTNFWFTRRVGMGNVVFGTSSKSEFRI